VSQIRCLTSGPHLFAVCPSAVAITQGGAIQLANNGTDGLLTMNAATQPGTTILQYAQTSDGQQILVPSNQVVVQGETPSLALNTGQSDSIRGGKGLL